MFINFETSNLLDIELLVEQFQSLHFVLKWILHLWLLENWMRDELFTYVTQINFYIYKRNIKILNNVFFSLSYF